MTTITPSTIVCTANDWRIKKYECRGLHDDNLGGLQGFETLMGGLGGPSGLSGLGDLGGLNG